MEAAGGRADGDGAADTLGGSGGSNVGRGEFISSLAASVGLGLGLAVTASVPGAASASVQFETERYGDKELKIATVNKLRQQIRNSVRAGRGGSARWKQWKSSFFLFSFFCLLSSIFSLFFFLFSLAACPPACGSGRGKGEGRRGLFPLRTEWRYPCLACGWCLGLPAGAGLD